jgi:hypothetical protein
VPEAQFAGLRRPHSAPPLPDLGVRRVIHNLMHRLWKKLYLRFRSVLPT